MKGVKGWNKPWTPSMARPWCNSAASSTSYAMEVDKCVGLDRDGKKSFMEQAAAVYQAPSAPEAQARLAAFGEQWRPTQPQTVATFEREFEQTIRYYSLKGMVREVVCTTSQLERTNRELRRKFWQDGHHLIGVELHASSYDAVFADGAKLLDLGFRKD